MYCEFAQEYHSFTNEQKRDPAQAESPVVGLLRYILDTGKAVINSAENVADDRTE